MPKRGKWKFKRQAFLQEILKSNELKYSKWMI